MEIEAPDTTMASGLTDLWVDLAASQRAFGSHVLPDENRSRVRESVVRHIVTDTLLVAREDDAVVGFVMFSVESGSYEQDIRRGIVENLFVAEPHRRDTVGQQLLHAAEATLADRGAEAVALEVMADNEDARRFYERNGYRLHRLELEKSIDTDSKDDA